MEAQTKRKINKITFSIFGGLMLLIIIIVAATSGGEEKDAKPKPFINPDHAWQIARDFVEVKLKSPSTADFPWDPDGYKMEGDSVIIMQGHVDSQNSFGAMMRTKFIIKMKFYGGDWADIRRWQELDFLVIE